MPTDDTPMKMQRPIKTDKNETVEEILKNIHYRKMKKEKVIASVIVEYQCVALQLQLIELQQRVLKQPSHKHHNL